MNRLYFAILAGLMSVSSYAQTFSQRGRIENVTDYEALAKVSTGGPNKVGTLSSAVLQCTGSPKIPVILVQFADTVFRNAETPSVVRQRYDDYFNLKEGDASPSMGSVYQYFKEQSYGSFTPEFDVIGPVTLSKSYAYYGKNSDTMKDVNINEFFKEACGLVVSKENKDWKTFDNNNDGKVDMVFFIYAGEGENNAKLMKTHPELIWPKESVSPVKVGNITFGAYGCTNELFNGVMDGIGTSVHELSHGLGLPDFYDYGGVGKGLDIWDVMDGGNYQIGGYCPIAYSAYERDFMGWRSIKTLDGSKAVTLTINPLEKDGVAYKIVNPANTNEYFILENRQNIGYDICMGIPNADAYQKRGAPHGLMITHVDYLASLWTSNRLNGDANHQRMSIVPADGAFRASWEEKSDFYDNLFGDLYPGSGNVRSMSSYKLFTGGTLNVTVDNIREVDGIVYVDINGGTVIPALKDSLKTAIEDAKTYTAKMGKSESDALAAAISAGEKVGATQDELEKAISDLGTAVDKAKTSIQLYKNVAKIIKKADALGEVGKASFAAAGVQTAYDNGTIETLKKVQAAYNAAVKAQTEADELAKAKAELADLVASYDSLKSAKMGKSELDDLTSALSAAESANDTTAVASATKAINDAVTAANTSVELYKKVADIITKADALGEAGKASFAAAGVQTAYDNGTIETLKKVQAAYDAAVKAQAEADELAKAKKDLTDLAASYDSLKNSKMGKAEADALASALSAAEKANDKTAIASATKTINDAVAAANTSVELYKKVAEIITKADALGEAGKASFAAAGVKTAYNNGTIESLAQVQAAYNAAVEAQEIANGIGEVSASSKASKIFGLDGKARTEVKKGVNIINGKKVIY